MNAPLTSAEHALPPHSIEAEHGLIGGLLLDNSAWDKISDQIHEGDFYRDDHRRIFRHIKCAIEAGRPADVITVFESIERLNEVEQAGGLAYLVAIASATPSAANIRRYAELIGDYALRRRIATVGEEIAGSAIRAEGRDARSLLDAAEGRLLQLSDFAARNGGAGLQSINEGAQDYLVRLQEIQEGTASAGVSTGFADLDRLTCGLQPGDMIVVAGRPAMGKSALALNIAEHLGVELGKPVAIFSLEMGMDQVRQRLISAHANIPGECFSRPGGLTADQWDDIATVTDKLRTASIFIDEAGCLTPSELRCRARRLHREHGKLGLIIIDYIQMMDHGGQGRENRQQEITSISRSIKSLAKELQVPIIALSQLSRKVEERADKRPIMSDLRESGAIEQDADLILLMYREEYYNPDTTEKGVAEIIVGKHRNGPTGVVKLAFQGQFARFRSLARAREASQVRQTPASGRAMVRIADDFGLGPDPLGRRI